MLLKKSEIISRVRLLLDEIGQNDGDFDIGKDDSELDAIIESLVLEALRFVNINAISELLEPDACISSTDEKIDYTEQLHPDANYQIGIFKGVSNFQRLVFARSSDWRVTVYDFVFEGTAAADMLNNRYLTGTPWKPSVLVSRTRGAIKDDAAVDIQLYTLPIIEPSLPEVPAEAKSRECEVYYMERPSWIRKEEEEDCEVRVSYPLCDAFFHYLKYLVLLAVNDTQRAQAALTQAMPLMGLNNESTS